MFAGVFTYLLAAFLIFWCYCGYILLLYLLAVLDEKKTSNRTKKFLPSLKIGILIPFYNEKDFIKRKFENIISLEYPKELLSIYFLDGGSDDGSFEELLSLTEGMERISVIRCKSKGKTAQLNEGLHILPKDVDIIVVTDADAEMDSGVLLDLAACFENDHSVGVAGIWVEPAETLEVEKTYWRINNELRVLESDVHSSSMVIAPCYAFRRDLLSSFPADCIADDIYVSFLANTSGKRTKYLSSSCVRELRCPITFDELLKHKFRKANAYIMELLRFAYMLPAMESRWKIIFLTKFLQVLLIPWVLPFFVLATFSFLFAGGGNARMVFMVYLIMIISFVLTHLVVHYGLSRKFKLAGGRKRWKRRAVFMSFIVTNTILILAGLSYPFYKQTSCFPKVSSNIS